jgi:cytoplasmic iron level regulating protein YaaA (DUF328/UPF0246 family)
MRILLPPSEAKRTGDAATADDTPALDGGGSRLAEPRRLVARALVDFCRRDPVTASTALALPARSAEADLAANAAMLDAPTMPALDRYAGIVYDGLAAPTLTPAGRRRAMESVLIFSGLFGVLRATEPVPAYRLPVAATLPGIGALTPFWRAALRDELDELIGDELTIDLRSSDYGAMWRPAPVRRERIIAVRIVTEQPGGRLAVISYASKHGKGRLARLLLSSRARITSADQIAQLWTDAEGRDAIIRPDGGLDLLADATRVGPD